MTALNRLFSEGFRVFFLAAGLWGVAAMLVWGLWLAMQGYGDGIGLPASVAPQHWHGHEMVFGFGGAAVAGFFLTAVPNWTGAPPAGRRFIATAAAVWALGRGAVWFWGEGTAPLAALLVLAFLPLLALRIGRQLKAQRKPADGLFLALLGLMFLAQIRVMLDWLGLPWGDAVAGLHGGIAVLVALVVVLGGRITPAFTRNALSRAAQLRGETVAPEALPAPRKYADRAAMGFAIAAALTITLALPEALTGVALLGLGAAQLLRMLGWRSLAIQREPILAVLHGAMALIGLGALMQAAAAFGLGSEIGAMHFTAIGGIGTMVLAVMSRASLGHSGRPLVAPGAVVIGYAALPLAALLRWAAAAGPVDFYTPGTVLAASLWALAFALFTRALWPAFWGPKLGA